MHITNEQVLISKKKKINAFSVNRKLINSKQFKDKFENLPLNQDVKQKVYKEVGRLLEYVDGQENEYLVALNFYDGNRIVDNFEREAESGRTGFSREEYKKIVDEDAEIITIHNHSYNGRPSGTDLITFYKDNRIKLSIIACHCGDLYVIFKVSDELLSVYDSLIEFEKMHLTDLKLIKKLATTKLYQLNEKINSKKKLFDVRRF